MNLTLESVEERSGIGVSTLSDYENGKREPKLSQLKQLADIYRRSIAFFLEEGNPVPEVVLWRQRPTSPQVEELERDLIKLTEQYHNLEVWSDDLEELDLPFSTGNPYEFGYPKAEKLAHDFRNKYSLGDRPGQSLLRVLEEVCKVKVFHLRFEPSGSAACTYSDKYGAAILLNSDNVHWRRNFDLAHEVFHLLTWQVFRTEANSSGEVASDREEKLATCFARNLLIPAEALRVAIDARLNDRKTLSFSDLFEVARQFDVSVEAILWQIGFVYKTPKEHTQQAVDQLRGQMSFWDNRERDTAPTRPLRFRALARQALSAGRLSTGRYAEYLGISRREAMQAVEQDACENAEVEVINS
jgi:Zn-dependent peptidase ImmA (M78 family)